MLTRCVSGCLGRFSIINTWLSPRSSFALLYAITIYLGTDVTLAMKVTSSGPQTLLVAQGEKETLNCMFTPDLGDIGDLDIEWALISPDTTRKDHVLISYSGRRKYFHGDPEFMKVVDFSASDPAQGDASLVIGSVTVKHAGTYQCKVKKAPGVDMQKLSLVVMEKPSVPKCWVEGEEAVGKPVSLHCKSDLGSAPLQYVWKRESGGPLPSSVTQNSFLGELLIYNHSVDLAGIYSCEVANAVGKQHCRVNLQAVKPPNRAGVIAGTVAGSLLIIIIVLIVLWLIVFRWERKHYEKELSNDIREDAPAPESRATSRGPSSYSQTRKPQLSSTSTSQTRKPQPSSTSTSQTQKPQLSSTSTSQTQKPQLSSTSTSYMTSKYDSKYGHIV